MCQRLGRRKRMLEAQKLGLSDLEVTALVDGEGYCPPPGSCYTGPTPYLLRSRGILHLREDGLGNVSGHYEKQQVFDPPVPMTGQSSK